MVTRTTKTRLATAGASLAIIAAVAGAGFAMPSDAAWAATSPAGQTQVQQAASPTPAPKPGRGGDQRQRGPQGGQQRGNMQQQHQAFQAALAGRLGVSTEQLKEAQKLARIDVIKQAVADGKLDQARADRMIESIQNGAGMMQPGQRPGQGQGQQGGPGQRGQQGQRPGPGAPGMNQGGPQQIADILGMTPQELRTEMQAGKSLAQVAEAKGISRDTLKAKLLEAHKTRIDAAVAAGKLTAEQAQKMTERANAHIDQLLDRTPGQRPNPRGPRTGG
jgi:hypothetical protein